MSSINEVLGEQKTTWVKTTTAKFGFDTEPNNVSYGSRYFVKVEFSLFNELMDQVSSAASKIARKMLERIDHFTNVYLGTYEEIEEMSGLSKRTVETVMAELCAVDFIRKVKNGRWMVNPSIALGCHDKYLDPLMNQYCNLVYKPKGNKMQKGADKDAT